jgi:uncharacterized CHY-type Zn-finger protein
MSQILLQLKKIKMKVNKYTRAGKNGKFIICPVCKKKSKVYHFSFTALQCQNCESMINKNEFLTIKINKHDK